MQCFNARRRFAPTTFRKARQDIHPATRGSPRWRAVDPVGLAMLTTVVSRIRTRARGWCLALRNRADATTGYNETGA